MHKEFIKLKLSELIPYARNPRKNENAVDAVAESIKQCGYVAPIIVDENNEILAGHTRFKALKKLKYTECEALRVCGLSEEQKKKFRILDNKTGELATWDNDLLLAELEELDFDGFDFGFGLETEENKYSTKTNIPQYEIQEDDVTLAECVDDEKTQSLITEIENAKISEDEKDFLIKAAFRHNVFNYAKIANYYAKASEEMQNLMEKSALVIIDYDDAIANGYVKLTKKLKDILGEAN